MPRLADSPPAISSTALAGFGQVIRSSARGLAIAAMQAMRPRVVMNSRSSGIREQHSLVGRERTHEHQALLLARVGIGDADREPLAARGAAYLQRGLRIGVE
jgi:hypothetical protein